MPFDVRRWVRSFLFLWFGQTKARRCRVNTPGMCEWNNGWPRITQLNWLVKVFTRASSRFFLHLLSSLYVFSLRQWTEAGLRSTRAWFWLRMCTFQHHFPSTRVWIWMSDANHHNGPYLDETHVSTQNKEQLSSHLKKKKKWIQWLQKCTPWSLLHYTSFVTPSGVNRAHPIKTNGQDVINFQQPSEEFEAANYSDWLLVCSWCYLKTT